MTPTTRRPATRRLVPAVALAALGLLSPLGCSTELLEVEDPDILLDANSPAGAVALRNGVVLRLAQAVTGTQGPDALFVYGGLLTDEWRSGDTFVQRNNQDQRIWDPQNTFNAGPFRALNRIRVEAQRAIASLRQWVPQPDSTFLIGQMYALTAYSMVLIGEHYCNGTPLSEVQGTAVVFGDPLSNDSLFALAVVFADSALLNTRGRDSARTRQLAAVVTGRALLDRGRANLPAAAAAVAAVATTFRFDVSHALNVNQNQIWGLNNSAKRYTMVDVEGGVGMNYMTANDPRLPRATGTSTANDLIFDSAFPLFVTRQGIWARTTSVAIASGIEARLIEAEAQLQAGNTTPWLTAINTLRTTTANYPAVQTGFTRGPTLTALAQPATTAAREDVMFRERAFWMFGSGHRLGDMRRLIRATASGGYGRTEAQVYPTGNFFKGGVYGDAIQLSIPQDEANNPNFTQCTDRLP